MSALTTTSPTLLQTTLAMLVRWHELWIKIWATDLTMVRAKLMSPKNEGMTHEEACAAIEAYRRYLFLVGLAHFPVVPTRAADLAWHHHILHTQKYAEDCRRLFGHYLHHRPTPEDAEPSERRLMRGHLARTANIHWQLFGEEYLPSATAECQQYDDAQPLAAQTTHSHCDCGDCDCGGSPHAEHDPRTAECQGVNCFAQCDDVRPAGYDCGVAMYMDTPVAS